jgi:hypothetical protein
MATTPTTIRVPGIRATRSAQNPAIDLAAYPILTEEVGYPPSPLARGAGGPGVPPSSGAGASLGQIVSKAVGDVLGWKLKPGDSKGFVGALNQAFTLTDIEGHTESKWTPRTYAVQTDLSGGLSGAQASLYFQGKVALEKCLPLLDGLYKLDPEAIDEDIAALRAVVKSQFSELVNELGFLGGPRVARVNQYFNLLLGTNTFPIPTKPTLQKTDADQIQGTLGNLRDEMGFNFATQDFVNSVEDETDLSNFRILADYVTALAQTWLNNVNYVVLNTPTPFFGTQLVLLSRQLSVMAESVDEVRFTLDSVFIGPAERQTMELTFPAVTGLAPIFLEDLLSWAYSFATEEGPRLVQDGGKFGVQNTFYPVVNQLLTMAKALPGNAPRLPPGFSTPRVQLSIQDLINQLGDLSRLAQPIEHAITPEPDFGLPLQVIEVEPNLISLANPPTTPNFRVRGSGFEFTATALPKVQFVGPSGSPPVAVANTYFRSESLLIAALTLPASVPLAGVTYNVQVTNPDPTAPPVTLTGGFTVTP